MTGVFDSECDHKKVEHTKRKIRTALLHLCTQKRLETITIKELTSLAGINRSTFYSHYTDIYDLRDQVLNDFTLLTYQQAVPAITRIVNGSYSNEDIKYLMDFYNENMAVFRAFLGKNFDPQLMERMHNVVKSLVYTKVGESNQPRSVQVEYVLEYIAAGHTAIITKWALSEAPISTEELITLIKGITMEGPIAFLLKG
ncbi:MAG: TetR/AcrR family transcriptional regulator [Syntrophomonadaceae bacterium]|nr:TetR/AcrR family transcriptional regulator [Syntrophomonadaceae bacterium]